MGKEEEPGDLPESNEDDDFFSDPFKIESDPKTQKFLATFFE